MSRFLDGDRVRKETEVEREGGRTGAGAGTGTNTIAIADLPCLFPLSSFSVGAVLGAAVPMGTNWNTGETASASGSTYIAFLVITLVGACIPFLLTKPSNVIRSDGSRVTVERQSTWKSEFKGLFFVLKSDPWVSAQLRVRRPHFHF